MSGRCFFLLLVAGWLLPASAFAQPAADPTIYTAVRTANQDGKLERGKVLGFSLARVPYDDRPTPDGILVGLDVGVGKFGDIETVYALRGVYRTPRGLVTGEDIGLFADKRDGTRLLRTKVLRTVQLRARAGYAVSGITVRSGLNINGLALAYAKIEGPRLAPRWAEMSDWVGDNTGGSEEEVIGDGGPVVGLHGKRDDDQIKSVGVYFARIPKPEVVVKPKVENPPDPPKVDKVEKPAPPVKPAVAPDPVAKAEETPPVPVAVQAGPGRFLLPVGIFALVVVPLLIVLLVMHRREQAAKTLAPAQLQPAPRPLGDLPADAITASAPGISPMRDPLDPRREPWEIEPPATKSADFAKAAKETSLTLFVIAGMQFVCGLVALSIAPDQIAGPGASEALPFMLVIVVAIAVLYAGVGVWGMSQPLPASIAGLGAYIIIFLLDVAGNISSGNSQAIFSGIFIKVCIVAALVRCIKLSAAASSSDSLQEMLRQHELSQARRRADEPPRREEPLRYEGLPRYDDAPRREEPRSQDAPPRYEGLPRYDDEPPRREEPRPSGGRGQGWPGSSGSNRERTEEKPPPDNPSWDRYTRDLPLQRSYRHKACGKQTVVSGDDYVLLECPFRPCIGTVCAGCGRDVNLDAVEWSDTGETISGYRARIKATVPFWRGVYLTLFGNAYEGAVALRLGKDGRRLG